MASDEVGNQVGLYSRGFRVWELWGGGFEICATGFRGVGCRFRGEGRRGLGFRGFCFGVAFFQGFLRFDYSTDAVPYLTKSFMKLNIYLIV